MQESDQKNNTELDSIFDESVLYRTFFGKNADYYEKIYNKMLNGASIVFNPYAFLFSVFWIAYRKMYMEAIVFIMGLAFLNNFAMLVFGLYIYTVIIFMGMVFAGCYANIFYMKKAERVVGRAKESYNNRKDQLDYIEQEGGVSFIGPVVVVGAIVLVYFGITILKEYIIDLLL